MHYIGDLACWTELGKSLGIYMKLTYKGYLGTNVGGWGHPECGQADRAVLIRPDRQSADSFLKNHDKIQTVEKIEYEKSRHTSDGLRTQTRQDLAWEILSRESDNESTL